MKKLLLLFAFAILTTTCLAQQKQSFDLTVNPTTRQYEVSNVFTSKLKKSQLYPRIKEWFSTKFPEKITINMDDKVLGKIVGKSELNFEYPTNTVWIKYHLEFTAAVQFKDNKYKCVITNFQMKMQGDEELFSLETQLSVLHGHSDNQQEKDVMAAIHTRLLSILLDLPEMVDKKEDDF